MLTHFPSDFLSGLSAGSVSLIEGLAQTRRYAPSECLFREGTPAMEFHVVLHGHVRLEMLVQGRGRVALLTVGPGEILAWSALLSDGNMTASATALDPVQTAAIPGKALRQLCEQHPDLGYQLMKQLSVALSQRLLATRLQLLDLFSAHDSLMPHGVAVTPVDPEC